MKPNILIVGVVGVLIGILLTGIAVFRTIPGMMLKTNECVNGYDETIRILQDRIKDKGWVVSGITSMNESLSKQGVEFEPKVSTVSLCHPDYAKSILTTDRQMSVMMPCKFSVWQGDDGKVYLTQMNTGLMGKMFGGNVAKVMGGNVADDEEEILHGLIKD